MEFSTCKESILLLIKEAIVSYVCNICPFCLLNVIARHLNHNLGSNPTNFIGKELKWGCWGGGGDSHVAFALSGAMIPQKTLFLYLLTYIFFTI
jgi:hypothetical protein